MTDKFGNLVQGSVRINSSGQHELVSETTLQSANPTSLATFSQAQEQTGAEEVEEQSEIEEVDDLPTDQTVHHVASVPSASDCLLRTIIDNQVNLAKKIVKMEKGMQEIFSQLNNVASMCANIQSRPNSAMSTLSNMSTSSEQPIEFQKIAGESDLEQFEKSIEDVNHRKKMIDHFVLSIGVDSKASQRSIALQLERKMFADHFWSKTAWTGGRNTEGPKKFAFCVHLTFSGFFNDVIRQTCGKPISLTL